MKPLPCKPTEPKKTRIKYNAKRIMDAADVLDVIGNLKKKGLDIDPADIEIIAEGDCDSPWVEAQWEEEEAVPDEEFERMMQVYNERLAAYKEQAKAFYEQQLKEIDSL